MAKSSQSVAPVYLLVGTEPLLLREAWEGLLKRVFGGEIPPMSVTELEGGAAQPADVLDEVRTPSFLADRKLVRLQNAEEMFKGRGGEGDAETGETGAETERKSGKPDGKGARELFLNYVENPCETGILVLQIKNEKPNTKLYKAVDKLGGIVDCNPPQRGFNAVGWSTERGKTLLAKTLQPEAARLLVDSVGVDLTLLANELEKLAIFVGVRTEITPDDVQALVGQNRTEQIFQIADHVAEGNASAALTHWRRLIDNDRDAPFTAVGALAYKFRSLLAARRLLELRVPEQQIIQQTGAWSLRGKLQRVLSRLSLTKLESALADLLDMDQAGKSGRGDIETAVEKFIVLVAR